MNEIYMYLNSSSREATNKNNFLDFTVNLPFNIDLHDCKWELGLCDIFFVKRKERWPNMYICCDVISSSFVNDKTLPVLRFIPEKEGRFSRTFETIHYVDVVCKSLNKIRVYIYNENHEGSSFLNETLYCTLHLRRKQLQ